MDVAARLEVVEAENEMLRERIAQLETLLCGDAAPPIQLGLTPSEGLVLGLLMQRDVATKDAVMAVLYRNRGRDEAEIKIVDVFICKMRRKLKPCEIEIKTLWGTGYALPAASKAKIKAMIAETRLEEVAA